MMIQCKDCEFFSRDENGRIRLTCDPFSTIKEPSCLEKMQLLRMDALLQSYQMMLQWYRKLGPMQEKMMEFMQREMDDYEDSESWKFPEEDLDEDGEPEDNQPR